MGFVVVADKVVTAWDSATPSAAPRWGEQGDAHDHYQRGGYYERERHEATSSMGVPGAWAIFIRCSLLVRWSISRSIAFSP